MSAKQFLNRGAKKHIDLTGSAQTIDPPGIGVHVITTGNIIGKLLEDTVDGTFGGLIAGGSYSYEFKSITSSTATGMILQG